MTIASVMLALEPAEIMMVACHTQDLVAAAKCGLRAAYVNRPLEYGPAMQPEDKTETFDYEADDFIELAQSLRRDKSAGII
ncbi:MAG: hypothetical protein GWP63_18130 [Haliea sp.]|jgi:2-haloacid dehalogenase|nr:hypothetical protein [Haliea sp.]